MGFSPQLLLKEGNSGVGRNSSDHGHRESFAASHQSTTREGVLLRETPGLRALNEFEQHPIRAELAGLRQAPNLRTLTLMQADTSIRCAALALGDLAAGFRCELHFQPVLAVRRMVPAQIPRCNSN